MVGLCTDICVVSNALIIKALYPEINVKVDARCCAGVTPESHEAASPPRRCVRWKAGYFETVINAQG